MGRRERVEGQRVKEGGREDERDVSEIRERERDDGC